MIKHKSRWSLVGLMWSALATSAICLLTFLPWQVAVGASGETFYVQTDTAAVRTAPSEDAEVLLSLSKGDKVMEFRRQGNWVKIAIFGRIGKEGWVRDVSLGKTLPGKAPSSVGGGLSAPPETQSKSLSPPKTKLAKFVLHIRRPSARDFRTYCKLIAGKLEKTIETKGRIPKKLSFSAEALSCTVRSGVGVYGRIWDIRLSKGGKLLASFDGSAKYVLLRSPGPWGKATARKWGNARP